MTDVFVFVLVNEGSLATHIGREGLLLCTRRAIKSWHWQHVIFEPSHDNVFRHVSCRRCRSLFFNGGRRYTLKERKRMELVRRALQTLNQLLESPSGTVRWPLVELLRPLRQFYDDLRNVTVDPATLEKSKGGSVNTDGKPEANDK